MQQSVAKEELKAETENVHYVQLKVTPAVFEELRCLTFERRIPRAEILRDWIQQGLQRERDKCKEK